MLGVLAAPGLIDGNRTATSVERESILAVPTPPAAQASALAKPAPKKAVTRDPIRRAGDPRDIFRGLGAWIDLYDLTLNPRTTVARMRSAGVRTLYIQSGRSDTPHAVMPGIKPWLVEAHRADMKVVAWYLPYYRDVERDTARILHAAYTRYQGHRFDGIGIDIEFRSQRQSTSAWNRAVVAVQRKVRAQVGRSYPVAAIVPPPLQLRILPRHWAGFPWRSLAQYSDAMLLMSYWSDRAGCPAVAKYCAWQYTAQNVVATRRLVGPRPVVHIIGGVADSINVAQLRAFIKAARSARADGVSIYDVNTTHPSWWRIIATARSIGV